MLVLELELVQVWVLVLVKGLVMIDLHRHKLLVMLWIIQILLNLIFAKYIVANF